MAIKNDYQAGTISIANGSTALTGAGGAMWVAADIQPGDTLKVQNLDAIIAVVNSNTSITLKEAWTGTTLSASPYAIRYQPDGSRFTAATRGLIERISNDSLAALQALTGAADKIPYFTSAGAMALADFGANARATLAAAKQWTTSLFSLTMAADKFPYGTGANTMGLADITAQGRTALANITAAGNALIDDADASAQLTTLGFSPFFKTLVDDVNGSTVRTSIGAQAALGFTPANAAGQVFTGEVEVTNNILVRAVRASATPGAQNTGGVLTSYIGPNAQNLSAQFFASEVVGTAVRAGLSANAGGSISYLLFTHTGNLAVPGTLSKGAGTFLIDHPLDPLNKDLAHGFVESPRYELIYRGRTKLTDGRATVDIDASSHMTTGTFAALTINAEVASLQNQDGFSRVHPTAVSGGSFEIICEDETSTDEVAWVVIAERNDAFVRVMDDNCDDEGRFIPERDKPE